MRISLIFGSLWVVAFGQWREIYPNNGQGTNLFLESVDQVYSFTVWDCADGSGHV